MRKFAVSACLLAACSTPAAGGAAAGCKQRLVSLHDVTTEAVLRYGAGACLVGVSEPTDLDPGLVVQLKSTPRVQSTESVLAAEPTQVLALAIVAEHQPELFRELDRRQIGWMAPRLERLADVSTLAADVAARSERNAQAAGWLSRLAALRPAPQLKPARVFVFDCCGPPYTAGRRAVLTDLLAHAGGQNVFADVDDDWFHASWEAAIERKPDLVLIDDYGGPENLAEKRAALARVRPLAELPVVVLPLRDALGTIRSAEVVQRLTAAIARGAGGV
ncbi:MAG TPA: ABC transporter substrate-binding protein [Polyangiales bacterium]|nr:ABC transporter substrate-binding protein [Polyangiales bacterium]